MPACCTGRKEYRCRLHTLWHNSSALEGPAKFLTSATRRWWFANVRLSAGRLLIWLIAFSTGSTLGHHCGLMLLADLSWKAVVWKWALASVCLPNSVHNNRGEEKKVRCFHLQSHLGMNVELEEELYSVDLNELQVWLSETFVLLLTICVYLRIMLQLYTQSQDKFLLFTDKNDSICWSHWALLNMRFTQFLLYAPAVHCTCWSKTVL